MLQLMRKHARNWLMKVVLGIIIVVFVFYFGSMRGRQQTETIAQIDGSRIVYAEFTQEYQRLLDFYRQRYGNQLTDDLIKQINLKQQAFDSTISQAIVLSKADELKLDVTDNELKASIFSYPAFQKNGSFDNALYQRVLRYQRMTPEGFEALQRRTLKMGKLERLIQESVKVSEREVRDIYNLQNKTINVDFIKIATDTAAVEKAPSEEDLERYLKEHGDQFRVPPMATIRYVAFRGESFAGDAKISDQEIEEYYDYNKGEFAEADTKKTKPLSEVRETIVSTLKSIQGMDAAFEAASSAHDTIYQEENFETYASEQGLDIQTAEFFRNAPPPGELAALQDLSDYVFTLEEGGLGRVFSDDKGYYVFELVSLKPSRIPGLGEVAQKVKESYAQDAAITLGKERAEDILGRLKKGEDLAKLSRKEDLKISETGLFLPGPDIPKIGYSSELGGALLDISGKNPYPERVFFVDGKYIVIRFKGEGALDEEDWTAKKDSLRNDILVTKGNEYFLSWLEGIKDNMTSAGRLKILKNVEEL